MCIRDSPRPRPRPCPCPCPRPCPRQPQAAGHPWEVMADDRPWPMELACPSWAGRHDRRPWHRS
eukprot:2773096-Alexandrium_andersonii.AAC.1